MFSYIVDSLATQGRLFRTLVKNPKFWFILGVDVLLVVLAHYLAYVLRFESHLKPDQLLRFAGLLPLILLIKIPLFYLSGLYRGMWRYTSLDDVIRIFFVSMASSLILVGLLLFGNRFTGFSRTVFILDALFTFGLIASHRMAIRYVYQRFQGARGLVVGEQKVEKRRLLLIGAGDPAEKVLRELQDNPHLPYRPVGLVTLSPHKVGMKLHGVPVFGVVEDLGEHARRCRAQELLIAAREISGAQMRHFVDLCQATGLPFKVLPGLGELITGKVSIKTIREIDYRDLLGREEVRLEQDRIGDCITGRTVLITGAGGSIGSELCRQLLVFKPGLIVLFDCSEENLYRVQMELRHEHNGVQATAVLGKVQDLRLLDTVFRQYQPAVVFHTAAYKHVPLVERNPWQAVGNNIVGSRLLMEAAILHRVERFVLVSTDKAVRPTNVMGASKRVTELLMLAYSKEHWDGCLSPAWRQARRGGDPLTRQAENEPVEHSTRFMGVRFGNVLGSSGSVIPLFKRQIEMGGPVTVTDEEVTRYFMSAEEAAQLILQAGSMGRGGEIFILKMGQPVRIADMARELIKLSGREPDTDIEVRFIGLRPGEKRYEELITEGEGIVNTHHSKIMVLRGERVAPCSELHELLEGLAIKALDMDSRGIKEGLQKIVPEYVADFSVC